MLNDPDNSSSPSSSSCSSDSSSDCSVSSGSSSEEEESFIGDKRHPLTSRDCRRVALMKPFNGKSTSKDMGIFNGLAPYNTEADPKTTEMNFSKWHANFVAHCNMACLSNDTRKHVLYCMTQGHANDYVLAENRHKCYVHL
jgi:hypothetical protein